MKKLLENRIQDDNKEKCCEKVNHSSVCLEDKPSAKLEISNNERKYITKIRIDDCLIKSSKIKKCDWAVFQEDSPMVVFVELKSHTIDWAGTAEQLISAINFIDNDGKNREKCKCIVVSKENKKTGFEKFIKSMKQNKLKYKHFPNRKGKVSKTIAEIFQ